MNTKYRQAYNSCPGTYAEMRRIGRMGGRGMGHMLQIFIRKDIVDDVAYSSRPLGVPTGHKRISELFDRGEVSGQARLFMSPELFTDESKTRIFYYCSSQEYSSTRVCFIEKLRDLFKPITDDPVLRKKARYSIKGIDVQ